ncbi:transcriptional regulator [Burkholderia vietnamiensis]|nr:transcriptional regulator [Burkholderia vietnamiensis]KVF77505.1 transcriptional regulator [Burkholderia vietnamiensis]KVF89629.1 transcriptional regulator [Burkholderia vietnamiensis]KVF93403.1 transcriptional regulator [Burkholderia vietnamiensis]KVF96482.1 transcriptional regulator [Burkholderia vietnamiensis]
MLMNTVMEQPARPQYRSTPEHSVIALGEFELNLGMRALYKAGREVPLGSRAFDILSVIVLAAGRIVSKDELMDAVWPGVFVEENNIHVHLSAVRKALGDHRQLIDTIPGRGYRLKVFDDPPAEPARDVPTERHAPHFRNADAMTAPRHRLPGRRTLLGRAAALDEIEGQFARSRVVTLTGPGGVGKTCLAIEHAHRTIATGASDVVFIDLEEAGSLAAVAQIEPAPSPPAGTLLVLDNAEHIVDEVADVVERLISQWPGLRVLLTSRERLRIAPETVFRVEPLALPVDESCRDGLMQSPAVGLFMERASRCGVRVDEHQLRLVAEICRRLDGLPLAIELAAERASVLGLEGVRQRLEERFLLLAGGYRTAQPRHRTLRAAFDWSFQRLTHNEQAVVLRIARFDHAFTLDSVYSVVCDDNVDRPTALDCIAQLVEKSILDVSFVGVTARYRLSESARTYALALGSGDEPCDVARQFARYPQ